jgi:hypothetical protein
LAQEARRIALPEDRHQERFSEETSSSNSRSHNSESNHTAFNVEYFGTWKAERDAYLYELKNAARFGLSHEEIRLIKQVMDTYYPKEKPLPR